MRPEDKRYILENMNKKSIKEIAQHLSIKEKKVRKFLKESKPPEKKPADTAKGKSWLVILPVLLIIIIGFSVYINSLNGEFVWDDGSLVVKNEYIRDIGNVFKMFTRNIRAGAAKGGSFYRPMQIFTYALDYAVCKLDVRGYHLTNIILHTLVALLIYWLINLLYNDRLLSFLTAALYVAHPVHTEAVAYISGNADSLVAVFMLLSLVCYIRYNQSKNLLLYAAMIISYIAALLSRENGLILPLALLLYHYSFKKKINIVSFLPMALMALTYIALRFTLLRSLLPPYQYCPTTFIQRLPGFFVAMTNYARVILFPFHLHMEYGERLFHPADPRVWVGLVIMVFLLFIAFRKKRSNGLISFSIFWFFVLLLPNSNLLPINAYMAEHWLYIPSIGFFLVIADGLARIYKKENLRIVGFVLIVALLLFYGLLTIRQNSYWREPVGFYERTLKYAPESAMVNNNLGEYYHRLGRDDKAMECFKRAIEVDKLYAGAYSNLANAYKLEGNTEEAISLYKKAITLRPNEEFIYYNLGLIYNKTGDTDEAISLFNKAIELNPEYSLGYNGLGVAYYGIGKMDEAILLFKKAISLNPSNPELYHNLGVTYFHIGRMEEGIAALEKTIEVDPTFTKAYKDLTVMYINKGEYSKAIRCFELGKRYGLNNPAIEEQIEKFKKGIYK